MYAYLQQTPHSVPLCINQHICMKSYFSPKHKFRSNLQFDFKTATNDATPSPIICVISFFANKINIQIKQFPDASPSPIISLFAYKIDIQTTLSPTGN